jgi:23S rRNA (cytosine1962-C5)-methyltransferase
MRTGMQAPVNVRLRKPLEDILSQGHPWVYANALDPFKADPGTVATVVDTRGRFVARGIVDGGPIAVRVFTVRDEAVNADLLKARIRRAHELRTRMAPPETDAWRLLHGEGDRLPGFVCDIYQNYAVLVLDGAGAEAWRDVMVESLREVLTECGVTTLLLRTGRGDKRRIDAVWGSLPEESLTIREHGMALRVDLQRGQKTGLFLDQRASRLRVRGLAQGMRVLNLYGYTGGFSVAAGLGGARMVTTVDIAPGAIDFAGDTWKANGLDATKHRAMVADAHEFVTAEVKAGARYDLVIADPPSFAPSEETLEAALKSYRTLHAACLGLLPPGGWYLAGSCSSHVNRDAFVATLSEGASRAKRVLQIVDRWGAPSDHPTLAAFPEGEYLKNVLARVTD